MNNDFSIHPVLVFAHSLAHACKTHPYKWVYEKQREQYYILILQIIHHSNTFSWMSSELAEWIEWFAWMPEHFRVHFHSFRRFIFLLFFLKKRTFFFFFTFIIEVEKGEKEALQRARKKNEMKMPSTEERTPKSPLYRCWKHETYERRKEKKCLSEVYRLEGIMQVLIQFIASAKSKEFIWLVCVCECMLSGVDTVVYTFAHVTKYPMPTRYIICNLVKDIFLPSHIFVKRIAYAVIVCEVISF